MGLSFHYKGRLTSASELNTFVEEVEDICKVFDWKFSVLNTEYPNDKFVSPLNEDDYGVIFTPDECEPVTLIFDSEGRIYNPWMKDIIAKHDEGQVKVITVQLNLDDEELNPIFTEDSEDFDPLDMVYTVSVKTQFTTAEQHVKIIELLRYISGKYFSDFEMIDESGYWTSRNPEKLDAKLNKVTEFIDRFEDMVSSEVIKSPEDFLKFIKKLSQEIKDKEK
ncbi:MAG TPA: hypothetical protein VK169_19095 [Saprospiraceae bacterium]|nr:hypothetical protein [Saprospiraceae bacterium]